MLMFQILFSCASLTSLASMIITEVQVFTLRIRRHDHSSPRKIYLYECVSSPATQLTKI